MGLTVAHSGSNGNSADRKARALRRALLVGGASALALTIAAPAFAQTSGGDGGESSNGTAGGAGGVGPNGEAGTDGVSGTFDGTSGTFGSGICLYLGQSLVELVVVVTAHELTPQSLQEEDAE